MRVLVTYATRHGATRGIAERIAAALEREQFDVALEPVQNVTDTAGFDAAVIGSAAYALHWLGDASTFVRRHAGALQNMPTWLFSCGPLGTDTVDAKGRDVRASSEPKELAEFRRTVRPRGTRVFFGAFDPDAAPVGMLERVMHAIPQAREAMPAGDFRDWAEVDAWGEAIAAELSKVAVPA